MDKEHIIKQKFSDYFISCGSYRGVDTRYYDISNSTKNIVLKIDRGATKFSWKQWKTIFDQYGQNPTVLYFLISNKHLPTDIRNEAIQRVLDNIIANNSPADYLQECTLLKALEHPLLPHLEVAIIKTIGDAIFKNLAYYNYEKSVSDETEGMQHDNACPYSNSTIKTLCNIAINAPKLKKDWRMSPFRFIKDNEYAKTMLNDPKCNEAIRSAIMNNSYLSLDVRMQAMEEADINNLINATAEMKQKAYEMACEAYFETEKEKRVKGAPEAKAHAKASDFLINKIVSGLFSEAMQIDLVNRIYDMNKGKGGNAVLGTIFCSTKSPKVLDMAEKFPKNGDTYMAYFNPNMRPETLKSLVSSLLKDFPKNKVPNLSVKKAEIINDALTRIELDDDIYKTIADNYAFQFALGQIMAKSQYTPTCHLEALATKTYNIINCETGEPSPVVNDIYIDAKISIILRKNLDPQLAHQLMSQILNFSCYNAAKFRKELYSPISMATMTMEYYRFKELGRILATIPEKTLSQIKADLKEIKPQNSDSVLLENAYATLINIINIGEKIMRMNTYFNFSYIFNEIVEKAANDILEEFMDRTAEDPLLFYREMDSVYKQFAMYQEELLEREEETDFHHETKGKNIADTHAH